MTYRIRNPGRTLSCRRAQRILALDGGGLRGILTPVSWAGRARAAASPWRRSGLRLCHYFDLMAARRPAAIIAAALAIGWSVEEVTSRYFRLAPGVPPQPAAPGAARARYDESRLIEELQAVFGAEVTLGSAPC